MIFEIKHNLGSSVMKTRPAGNPQEKAQLVYSIPCEYGRSYVGETGRPLAVQLCESRHNLKENLIEKQTKIADHVSEEGHWVVWNEARFNSRYRKSGHLACSAKTISQTSLEMSTILI
jgi:hypothetical protein